MFLFWINACEWYLELKHPPSLPLPAVLYCVHYNVHVCWDTVSLARIHLYRFISYSESLHCTRWLCLAAVLFA